MSLTSPLDERLEHIDGVFHVPNVSVEFEHERSMSGFQNAAEESRNARAAIEKRRSACVPFFRLQNSQLIDQLIDTI